MTLITYTSPAGPVYAFEDLKLEFGNTRFQELLAWIEENVPATRRMKYDVAVSDVERFLTHRRRIVLS